MRKILALLMVMVCSEAFALELPETIGEWQAVSKKLQPLITSYNGETQSTVTYATYEKNEKKSPSSIVEVILTEGTGTGTLYIPQKVNTRKGVMPSDSGYELVKVYGHDAILEAARNMPIALAVNVSKDVVLTVETGALDAEGIIVFAEEIIRGLKIQ